MTSGGQTVGSMLVVGLSDLGAGDTDPGVVGRKTAHLGRLAASGFRVPDGFVITTDACARIQPDAAVRPGIWAEILTHLDRLGRTPLAVRSSGTAEDLHDASYAGRRRLLRRTGRDRPDRDGHRSGRAVARRLGGTCGAPRCSRSWLPSGTST